MFASFGTEVTIGARGKSRLSGYEPEIAEVLTEILQEEGLRIVTGAQVRGAERSGEGVALSLQRHGSQQTFTADSLLVSTGRRPNTEALGLERAGVERDTAGQTRRERDRRTNSHRN